MAGDLDVAIERLEEVLRLDQMFGEAWATLASCYEETGPPDKARVMRFGALHFEGEADDWKELAFSFRSVILKCTNRVDHLLKQHGTHLWTRAHQYQDAAI